MKVLWWHLSPTPESASTATTSAEYATNEKPLLNFVYQGVVLPKLSGSSSAANTAGADYARVLGAWNDTAVERMPVSISSGRLRVRGASQAQFKLRYVEVDLDQLAALTAASHGSASAALDSMFSPGGPTLTDSPQEIRWEALVTSAAVCPTTVQYSMPPNQQDSTVTVEITNLAVTEVVVVVTPSIDTQSPSFPRDLILNNTMTLTPSGGGQPKVYNAVFDLNNGRSYSHLRCANWVCAFSASASSPLENVPYALNLNATSARERLPKQLTAATVPAGSTLGVYLNVEYARPENGEVPRLQEAQRQIFTLNFFEPVPSKPRTNEAELPQYKLLEQRNVSVTMTRQLGRASRARSQLLPLRPMAPGNAFVFIKAQGQGLRPVALLVMKDAFGHPRPCAGDVPVIDAEQTLVELGEQGTQAGNVLPNATQIVTSYTPVGPGLYVVSIRAALPGLVSLSARLSSSATAGLQPLTIKVLPADCSPENGVVPDIDQNSMTCLCDVGHGGSISDGISASSAQGALRDQRATAAQMADIFSPQVRDAIEVLKLPGMNQSIAEISLATGGVADTGGLDVCGIYTQGSVGGYASLPSHVEGNAFEYTALESLTSLVASKESAGRVQCTPCDAGEHSAGGNVDECIACSAGQFSAAGSAKCKACPDFGATCVNGVLSVDDDHWWEKGSDLSAADAATEGLRFHACPFLGLCNVESGPPKDVADVAAGNQGSANARRLVSLAANFDLQTGEFTPYGHREFKQWWAEATADVHYHVQTARALQTIGNFTLTESAALTATSAETHQYVTCAEGHRGPMCQSCEPGYVNGGTGACMRCTNVTVSWLLFVLTILVVGLFCVFWIRRRVRRSRFRTTQSGAQRIGLSFIQMCTVLTALRLRVPELFGVIEQGGSAGDGISMDLYPIQCTFKPTYHERLLGYMLLPMLAVITPAILLFATLPLRRHLWAKRDAKRRELLRKLGVNDETGESAAATAAKDDSVMVNPMRAGGSKPLAADADSSKRSPVTPKSGGDEKGKNATKSSKKSKIPRREMPPTVEGSKNLAYASAVVLVFLVYNRVFRELVSAFHEYQFPIEDSQRLVADLLVKADSPEHLGWRVIAGVLLAVYAVGLPIGTLILLYRNREHLWPTAEGLALEEKLQRGQADTADSQDASETGKDGKKLKNQSQAFRQAVKIQGKMDASDKTKLSALLAQHQVFHRFSFLYDGYRHDLYWWEVLVVLRKILVVLVSATITDGHTQMFAAAGIVTIALALQLSVQPYLIPALNALETLSLCSTLILMLGSLLFWQVGAERGPALALTAVLFVVLIVTLLIFLYAFLGGASKSRLRKAIGEKNFKMGTRCIKRSCKNKRSPAEIRAEMLADEAQYDAGVAKSSAVLAKASTSAESKAAVSRIGTDSGGMMANPLTARNPLMNASKGTDNKTRKGFTPQGRV